MKDNIEKIDYSKFSAEFLAAIAEQGLPRDSKDPDEIRVNKVLFERATDSASTDALFYEVLIAWTEDIKWK